MSDPSTVMQFSLSDVVAVLEQAIEGSRIAGIAIGVDPHSAHDPTSSTPGHSSVLVTLTDPSNRRRVVELNLRAQWLDESCCHDRRIQTPHGMECLRCGDITPLSARPRCLDCNCPVSDPETYYGVHSDDCGYWDERCRCCHRHFTGPGTAPVSKGDPRLCVTCAEFPGNYSKWLPHRGSNPPVGRPSTDQGVE